MSQSLRLVFAGTPDFAVPALRTAAAQGELVGVFTQPDRPAGRGRALTALPVKQAAQAFAVPIMQPDSLRDPAAQDALRALSPDLLIVVAYGLILPKAVLAIPRYGCWNVHASLLPRWRGAAPIQRAIEAGDHETGVCLMQMARGLDSGPLLLQLRTPISEADSAGSVHDRLAELGAQVLGDGLALLRAGLLPQPTPQPEAGVSYAHKLDKGEARLDWNQPAAVLARKVRAFNPWPIAEAELAGERVRIHAAIALADSPSAAPGSVLQANRDGIDIACAEHVLRLLSVQRDGGKPLPARDYLNARPALLCRA